jgi:tetratricopeptide (TPR) repeat protein
MSKCFVSFSSRDSEFVGKLLASFRLQDVDVWDYSNPAQDIQLGENLRKDIRRLIDTADHFVAVITPSSTHPDSGRFCIFELQHAHNSGKRIIPITLEQHLPVNLAPGLAFLQEAKYLSFKISDNEAYERAFKRLCAEMNVPYVLPFLGDPRIIFAPRFDREIRGLSIPNVHRIELRLIIDEFTRQYKAGEWAEAAESITFFISGCKRWARGIVPYYPTLLLSLCKMHQNCLSEAEKILEALLQHPLVDENAWAALGQIDYMQGEYAAALGKFKIARDKCPPGKDWEARFNILAASVQLGRTEEASAAFSGFDLESRPVDDQLKIANLQASLFSRNHDWRAVVVVLRDIFDRKIGDEASAVYLAEAYEHRGESREAVTVLSSEADRLCSMTLYHRLAALYVRLEDPVRALEVYESKLLADTKHPWQMATDYALILRSIGRCREADEVCCRALNLPVPSPGAETYFRGLAFYLVGREQEAKTFFADSNYREKYYDQFV